MTRARLSLSALQRLLQVALLVPLLLSAFVPQGVMPGGDGAGGLVMVLCSGDGPVEITLDPVTGEPVEKRATACDWACGQFAAALIDHPALPPRAATLHRAAAALPDALWQPAHDPRSLWARGPPSLA